MIYIRSEVRSECVRQHLLGVAIVKGGRGGNARGRGEQVLRRMPNVMMGNLVGSDREVQLEETRLQDDGVLGERRQVGRVVSGKRETGGKLA